MEASSATENRRWTLQIDVGEIECGNGVLEPGEACEDGNLVSGDGCSDVCEVEARSCMSQVSLPAPYTVSGSNWENLSDNLQLDSSCFERVNGEKEMVFPLELQPGETVTVSEHGNADVVLNILPGTCGPGVQCAAGTEAEHLGTSYSNLGSTAETVYLVVEAASPTESRPWEVRVQVESLVCGDGVLQPAEACEDGNLVAGDGCSDTCTVEARSCTDYPTLTASTSISGANWQSITDDLVLDAASCREVDGAKEMVWAVEVPAGDYVEVSEHGSSAVTLSILEGSCDGATACHSSETTGVLTYANSSTSTQTIFVVAELTIATHASKDWSVDIELTTPICGDGLIEPGEACDDGNDVGGDGCSATCIVEATSCADYVLVQGSYALSGSGWDSLTDDVSFSDPTCSTDRAGKDMVYAVDLQPGEYVTLSEPGSSYVYLDIQVGACGNAEPCVASYESGSPAEVSYWNQTSGPQTAFLFVNASSASESNSWRVDIEVGSSRCGDGIQSPLELCEDGNTTSGDGCSSTCDVVEPSNCSSYSVIDSSRTFYGTWEGLSDDIGLGTGCEVESLEEDMIWGVRLEPGQSLDVQADGGSISNVSILNGSCVSGATCVASTRRDNETIGHVNTLSVPTTVFVVLEAGWSLTRGSFEVSFDLGPVPQCGDAILEGAEECDDGNTSDGDGCSADCRVLLGETCGDAPTLAGPYSIHAASWSNVSDDLLLDGVECARRVAPEVVYRVDLAPGQTVTASNRTLRRTGMTLLVGSCDVVNGCYEYDAFEVSYTNPYPTTLPVYLVVERDLTSDYEWLIDIDIHDDTTSRDLASITAAESTVQLGQSVDVTVALSAPAPAGGTVVKLDMAPGTFGTAPRWVTIPEGQQSATFAFAAHTTDAGTETISATLDDTTLNVSVDVVADPDNCLIISEYVEGSGTNNKAVELFNCSSGPLQLDNFGICVLSNDWQTCSATAMLAPLQLGPGEVHTVCRSKASTDPDPLAALAAACAEESPSTMTFNGDDRLIVFLDDDGSDSFDSTMDTTVDAFGESTVRPASQIWANTTYRRCDFTAYDGTTAFNVADYFTVHALNDVSDYGTAPIEGCP
jgi:cysteine-rich repeat protein